MKNKHLKKIHKLLDAFSCSFAHDDILCVSDDNEAPPFAYVICDSNHPNHLLISYAVDYPVCDNAAIIALVVNGVKSALVAEPFFINEEGLTIWENASHEFEKEQSIDLNNIQPISKLIN